MKRKLTYTMTPRLERILKEVEKDIKAGKNLSPIFDNAKEMNDYLDNLKT